MTRCPNCRTILLQGTDTCPLCHCVSEELSAEEQETARARYGEGAPYPNAQRRQKLLRLWLRIILFTFISSEAILIVINHYTTPQIWWSAITAAALVYGYLFLLYWVRRDSGFAAKVGLQMIFTMILLWLIDRFTGNYGWALTWAIPGVILFGDGIVFLLMMLNRSRWFSYTLLLLVLGICSAAILSIEIAMKNQMIILPIICVVITDLYLVGTILFGERAVSRELKRRFHV